MKTNQGEAAPTDTLDDFGAGVLDDPKSQSINTDDEPTADIDLSSLLTNPLTGAVVDVSDIDSLILECDSVKTQLAELREFDKTLRNAAAEHAKNGTGKTRRIAGKRFTAKVEMGNVSPVQGILKEVWAAFPDVAKDYLRIDSLGVKAVELKKLMGTTTDDPKLATVRSMLKDAQEKGSVGMPTVSMEKPKGGE